MTDENVQMCGNCKIGDGISLRDWFAGLAMQGRIMRGFYNQNLEKECYEIADRMLEMRKPDPQKTSVDPADISVEETQKLENECLTFAIFMIEKLVAYTDIDPEETRFDIIANSESEKRILTSFTLQDALDRIKDSLSLFQKGTPP